MSHTIPTDKSTISEHVDKSYILKQWPAVDEPISYHLIRKINHTGEEVEHVPHT